MKCPFCENQDTSVVDSRDAEEGKITRRRRECAECDARFTTYERPELADVKVIKRNNEVQAYQREKIEQGLVKATEKRPIDQKKIQEIVDNVESQIFSKNKETITSKEIGRLVIEELKKTDQVAYLRFLSVYQSFGSLASFDKEIKKLIKHHGGKRKTKS
ncbi:MAG: transcriptional regulator NrdR [Patescibacteria group bacterium]|nr:transcriptional regulator NrdR [Patescibacteria group bacterium]